MINSEFSEVGIIHLSDIHFSTGVDFITPKFNLFYNALKDDFQSCNHIFIIVSGDIASKGLPAEYKKALDFFRNLTEKLKARYASSKIRFIFIPGNHDCNFSLDSKLRQNTIQNITYDTLGDDNSVLVSCIQIQADFWNFFAKYEEVPKNKAFYRITEEINNKTICFHCFNTAWMSQEKEKPGTLFFPVKNIPELDQINEFDLNIAVIHHPINWFNPNTDKNNKKEFQNALDTISSLHIFGHEHENELRTSENLDSCNSKTMCANGEIFQDLENSEASGFQTLVINIDSNILRVNRYRWAKDLYRQYSQKEHTLEKRSKMALELQESFVSKLNKLTLPLSFENKRVTLSDLYVYPHLEHMNMKSDDNIIEDYVDSSRLPELAKEGTYILEGESQIGKSSLLSRLMLASYEKGLYPILLDGSKLYTDNIEKLVKEAFKLQYIDENGNYDRYRQLPKQKKALFIDDFNACHLSREIRNKLIENFEDVFGFVFLTIDSAYGMFPQCQSSFRNLNFYSIKPFGYVKRNLLIERYLRCRYSDIIDNEKFLEVVKVTFDKLSHILGNKLIPPYPVFLLTIIQALDYTPINTNETSYGYCYQTLIHLALNKVGVIKDHIDSYINFITELAFEIFNKDSKSISESEFESFFIFYHKKFWAPDFATIKENLLKSEILKNDYEEYKFAYIYIFYFLAAKKIAELIDTEKAEGERIVSALFENLHIERNANILVFVTHHTKNEKFIDESILIAMTHFDGIFPITLEKNCNYYKLLEEIVREIKNDVIEMRDPIQERNRLLLAQDKCELETSSKDVDSEKNENDIQLRPFLHTLRSIEIVGQIIKNRKGSLEIPILKDMIVEMYNTAFRMINSLGELIKQGKNELARQVVKKVENKDSNYDIEKKVYRFLNFIALQACLGTFSKLIQHIGVKELHELFNEVANEINTPAAHLVSFSINSYYGKINMKELENLSKEFKDNPVAFQILRSRVKAYVYNNHVDYRLKQKIGAAIKMNLPAKIGHKNQGI